MQHAASAASFAAHKIVQVASRAIGQTRYNHISRRCMTHLTAACPNDRPEGGEQLDADPDAENDFKHQPHIVSC